MGQTTGESRVYVLCREIRRHVDKFQALELVLVQVKVLQDKER